jgi:hypothetical protein
MTLTKRNLNLGTVISLFVIGLFLLYLVFSIVELSDKGLIVFALPFIAVFYRPQIASGRSNGSGVTGRN